MLLYNPDGSCLQERLVMSILPRFLVLEMIADMAPIDEYLLPQQFQKIYIHQYKDVRYQTRSLNSIVEFKLSF